MKQIIFLSTFLFNFLVINVCGQGMWELNEPEMGSMVAGLSLDSLKNIILNDEDGWNSDPNLYEAAAEYLLYHYRDSQAQFLLENLNTQIDTTREGPFNWEQWHKYYVDQYIKGLLGNQYAIPAMDSIARFCPDNIYKMLAIRRLTESGRYNYWGYVKNNKNKLLGRVLYVMYGKDSRYTNEVRTTLENELNTIDPNNWIKITSIAEEIASFDSLYRLELINEYFESTDDTTRFNYFFHLGSLDYNGQPERTIFALQNEENDYLRAEYIPRYLSIKIGLESNLYLEPYFISFLDNISFDPNSFTNSKKNLLLTEFLPSVPDSHSMLIDLIHNLINLVDTVYNYTWLGDLNFSNELKNILTTAKTNLQNGDSLACRVQVKAFQDLVDNVYKDSLNTDPRFVTIEGWKFLYWNAQYILDRLPKP